MKYTPINVDDSQRFHNEHRAFQGFECVVRTGTNRRPEGQQLMENVHHDCAILQNSGNCLHHVLDEACVDQSLKGDCDPGYIELKGRTNFGIIF